MKIEKLEELKERVKEIIETETEDIEDENAIRFDFEVESGTEIANLNGGKIFNNFDKALNYTIEQIKEQTDKDIQNCEDFEHEEWYQINLLINDETYYLIAFKRVSENKFKVANFGDYSYL